MAAKAKNSGVTAGKRRVTTVEETVEEGAAGGELELEPADPEGGEGDDFLDVLAELAGGSEAKCEIRRTSPAEYAGYCCTYALSEMSLDRLQEEWGGGKFNVRVRNARGEFKGSTSVQIAGKARNRGDGVASAPAPAAAQQVDIAGIISAAQASNKPQIDMLTSLVTALINKPAPALPPPGPSVLEIIGELAPILKPDKGGADTSEVFKMFREGLEMGRELGGGGDDSMLGIAAKGMDMVKSLAASAPARPRPRPAPRPALSPPARPAPGSVPAQEVVAAAQAEAAEIVNPEDPPMLKLLNWIKQQTALLCYQAARGKDPQLYADLFLDNIPQGVSLDTIYEQMEKPDAIAKLAEVNPNVLKFPEWMEAFRQAVLAGLIETPDEAQPAGSVEETGEDQHDVGTGGEGS